MMRLVLAAALAASLSSAPAAHAAPRCKTPAGKLVKCPAKPVAKAAPTALCKTRNKAGACVTRSRPADSTGRAVLKW